MLTFDQKLAIISQFPELTRKDVSLGRVNFHFEGSLYDKKTVVYHLHPNGNGFVYAGRLSGQPTDDKGLINIRDHSEAALRTLLRSAIDSLAQREDQPEQESSVPSSELPGQWTNGEGHRLVLAFQDDLWYLFDGPNLEMAFETAGEAREYLQEEGFTPMD
ncbi:hypothetical protein [Paenibacillus sp. 1P07SE]|uniref:hypothetical protein n=1 Tax=Paenibacillus sp. 1P07SE TaxID=3132209 RepID=UPI0039A4F9EA